MRIICDHCSRPISGTVKRLAGNFNFHPDCMLNSVKKQSMNTAVSWRSQESLVNDASVEWNRPAVNSPLGQHS